MGLPGQADGWSPKSSIIKGPFIRAKHMQAKLGLSTGILDSKHLTNSQYNAYLDESWTFKTSPEHTLTGMSMVVEAITATNCGLRAEDSRELRWPMLAVAELIDNIRPAPCIPFQLGLRRPGSKTSHIGKAEWFTMVENILPQRCPVLAVACLLIQSQPAYQEAFLKDDDTFWEHRLLAKGTLKSKPVKYDSLHAQHSKIMASIGLADDKAGTALHISGQPVMLCWKLRELIQPRSALGADGFSRQRRSSMTTNPLYTICRYRCSLEAGEVTTRKSFS